LGRISGHWGHPVAHFGASYCCEGVTIARLGALYSPQVRPFCIALSTRGFGNLSTSRLAGVANNIVAIDLAMMRFAGRAALRLIASNAIFSCA
jgi:hypothetical protein